MCECNGSKTFKYGMLLSERRIETSRTVTSLRLMETGRDTTVYFFLSSLFP